MPHQPTISNLLGVKALTIGQLGLCVGGLHELDQDPAAVFGVDEVHEGARGANFGLLVEHPDPAGTQGGGNSAHVGNPVRHLLDPRSGPVDEFGTG